MNTVTLNETVSPGNTLSSSPSANVIFDAKSNISTSISSISLSSSSLAPSSFISSFSVGSLVGSSSDTESISSGDSPFSSSALCISAALVNDPAASAVTVNVISTDASSPGAIGPATVKVVGPLADNPAGTKSSITIFEAGTVPWLNTEIVKVISSPG